MLTVSPLTVEPDIVIDELTMIPRKEGIVAGSWTAYEAWLA
jgi:hypothetical protein